MVVSELSDETSLDDATVTRLRGLRSIAEMLSIVADSRMHTASNTVSFATSLLSMCISISHVGQGGGSSLARER